jgi:IS30 family transposase
MATHVERSSRYLIAARLPDKTAEAFTTRSIRAFRSVPRALRHTLTLDNGKENARFQTLEDKTGLTVFFADPYSPWQRPTNENTNGLLRQYFPKGSDFTKITDQALAEAVQKINHRPRKCLGYPQAAAQMFKHTHRPMLLVKPSSLPYPIWWDSSRTLLFNPGVCRTYE